MGDLLDRRPASADASASCLSHATAAHIEISGLCIEQLGVAIYIRAAGIQNVARHVEVAGRPVEASCQ